MPIPCAVLMCHAPIVVPEVAGDRAAQCSRTTRAMTQVAQRLSTHAPDVLVVISPHARRDPYRWSVCAQDTLHGNFGRFGVPEVGLSLPGARRAASRVAQQAHALSIELVELQQPQLDHGALVPLYFVRRAGFAGPTLLIAPPARRTDTHEQIGRAIAHAAAEAGERWVVLASGDMSHKLQPSAPCGYDPRAQRFDDSFRQHLDSGALREACTTDPALRELAAEDVVDSVAVAAAAVEYCSDGHQTYCYEGPFGVGYLEAVLFESQAAVDPVTERSDASELPWPQLLRVAREAIASHLSHTPQPYASTALPERCKLPSGVFVTLRDRRGALRGCVGHVEPVHSSLVEEVAACAVAAATRDRRFQPVTPSELPELSIELSLLSQPELVSDLAALDPKRYGVVVSCGHARGVLLPDVPGVSSAAEQVRIAASKGQLPPQGRWTIERFEVRKHAETAPSTATKVGHAYEN